MTAALVAVCGLQAEAKIARGPKVTVLVGGGDQTRLERELHHISPAIEAMLSIGVAGGLAPDLRPGAICLASEVVLPSGERLPTDARWSAAMARLIGAPSMTMAGVDAPVTAAAAKAELYRRTGARVVDMESHIVARVAAAHNLPFAVLRVVTDSADRELPHAASVGMRLDGRVDLPAILRSLARDPGQLPGLIRAGLDARVAFAALFRSRQRLGADFAFFDLD